MKIYTLDGTEVGDATNYYSLGAEGGPSFIGTAHVENVEFYFLETEEHLRAGMAGTGRYKIKLNNWDVIFDIILELPNGYKVDEISRTQIEG